MFKRENLGSWIVATIIVQSIEILCRSVVGLIRSEEYVCEGRREADAQVWEGAVGAEE